MDEYLQHRKHYVEYKPTKTQTKWGWIVFGVVAGVSLSYEFFRQLLSYMDQI